MTLAEQYLPTEDMHPIDMVESLAEAQDWEFDRIDGDQIAMAVEGQWRTYSITLAWSAHDQTLRLVSTFELEVEDERRADLHELLNLVNDRVWTGAFTYWPGQDLMVWRYGLALADAGGATPAQIDAMIGTAVGAAERFYPAFQLAIWGDTTPEGAMQAAIAEAYGRA